MPALPPPVHRIVPFDWRGQHYRAVLDPSSAYCLKVFHGRRLIDSCVREQWSPWRLEVGDVDGDGYPDFLVGVSKPTKFLPMRHTCLFVYTFNGKRIFKKWLGSTMGRPLIDFCLAPRGKRDGQIVLTLQRTPNGEPALDQYRWSGFGFRKVANEIIWPTAQRLRLVGGQVEIFCRGKTIVLNSNQWK